MGFALALAARFMAERGRAGLVLAEDFALRRGGRALWAGSRRASGSICAGSSSCARPTRRPCSRRWRTRAAAARRRSVVGEAWSLKGYDLAASRRLLLAARAGATPALLVAASAYGAAEQLSSAAETRFEIAAAPSAQPPFGRRGARRLPGPPCLRGAARQGAAQGGRRAAQGLDRDAHLPPDLA